MNSEFLQICFVQMLYSVHCCQLLMVLQLKLILFPIANTGIIVNCARSALHTARNLYKCKFCASVLHLQEICTDSTRCMVQTLQLQENCKILYILQESCKNLQVCSSWE